MSIHGNQYLLPLFIDEAANKPFLEDNDGLALSFYLMTKKLDKNHKILSFSKLLWPFLSIQGIISTHIFLDGLKVFSKKGKFTNPPRQPLIGHILRNIDNNTKLEQLNRIENVLTYKDKEAEELSEGEESEFQVFQIKSLTNPEFLNALMLLVPYLEYKPIKGYMPLDTTLTTDEALNIAEKYRNIIETLKGNALRWESQIDLIENEIEKWIIDLNVELKDTNARYKSKINKITQRIDDGQVRELSDLEHDKIEQWKVTQKKKLVDNIATNFKSIGVHLEEILKRNRFFSSEDLLKRKSFENLIPSVNHHFKYLYEEIDKLKSNINNVKNVFEQLKQKAIEIDNKGKQRIESYQNELTEELKIRNSEISKLQEEKEKVINEIKELKKKIEDSFNQIKKIIQEKKQDCLNEANDLKKWSVEDDENELFAKPIQWIYMPLYMMIIEDEDLMEEEFRVIFPGYIHTNNLQSPYVEVSDALINLKDFINEKIDNDMVLRSNFEFSIENKNILKDLDFEQRIHSGISSLKNMNIVDTDSEQIVKDALNKIA